AGDVHVRLRLPPDARWVAEYYATTDPQEQPDGSLEVTLPSGQLARALRLLLRLGPRTEVLSPLEVGEQLRALAIETLAVYGRWAAFAASCSGSAPRGGGPCGG